MDYTVSMILEIFVDLFFAVGLTLGVGSSTFALIFFINSLRDVIIDESKKQQMHIVYTVLRVGMGLLTVAIFAKISLSVLPISTILSAQSFLLFVITANAILMTYKLMPMMYGPALAGGSWYSLFLVTHLAPHDASLYWLLIEYILFLIAFYCTYTLFVLRFLPAKPVKKNSEIDELSDSETLSAYAHDASAFSVTPKAVYFPKNVNEVVKLVILCREDNKKNGNASLTVRAGGTCMSGGPLNDGWIVDMTRHMTGITIDAKQKVARVEMGAKFRDIEAAAAKHGLMFAPYPSSRLLCGIGGMIGNNASGEKSIRYGATSDNVVSLEVVLADGSVREIGQKPVRDVTDAEEKKLLSLAKKYGASLKKATGSVRKSASGYALHKVLNEDMFSAIPVFVGAQGTLGIVTRATIRLVPKPRHLELLMISATALTDVSPVLQRLFRHNPEGIETFDINTFLRAREHIPVSASKVMPYIDENAHLFILAQFSEKTATLTSAQAQKCLEELTHAKYFVKHIVIEKDKEAAWDVRRNSFTLMRDFNEKGFRAVPCIEDVIVPLSKLGEFIKSLIVILKKRNIHYGFHGHIGDGSLRIIPIFDFKSPRVADEIIGLMKDVFKLVKKLDGNTSADHSDGIVRTPFLEEFYGKELNGVFGKIKKIYDADNIMNPRKKVGGTIDDFKKSLK